MKSLTPSYNQLSLQGAGWAVRSRGEAISSPMHKVSTLLITVCFFILVVDRTCAQNHSYVINGEPITDTVKDQRFKALESGNILSITVLKDSVNKQVYPHHKQDDVILIVTKDYAKKQYQKKLSAFSREYLSYLSSNNNQDDDIQYIVHSDPLEKQEVINFLSNLPAEKIISVTFTENPAQNGGDTKKTVTIDLKVGE